MKTIKIRTEYDDIDGCSPFSFANEILEYCVHDKVVHRAHLSRYRLPPQIKKLVLDGKIKPSCITIVENHDFD